MTKIVQKLFAQFEIFKILKIKRISLNIFISVSSIFPTFYLKYFGELQSFRFKYYMVWDIQKREVICEGKVLAQILKHLCTAQIEDT
jgi:hypothetical protein